MLNESVCMKEDSCDNIEIFFELRENFVFVDYYCPGLNPTRD